MNRSVSIICVVAALVSGCGESTRSKLDRDFSYHELHRRDAPKQGVRLGTIAVPGYTQEVTLFLGGIPPDSREVEGVNNDPPEVPYIFAEMNREPDLDMVEDEEMMMACMKEGTVSGGWQGLTRQEKIERYKLAQSYQNYPRTPDPVRDRERMLMEVLDRGNELLNLLQSPR